MRRFVIFSLICLIHHICISDVISHPLNRVEANYGPGCHIAAVLPKSSTGGLGADASTGMGGMAVDPMPKSWRSSLDTLGFGIYCETVNNPDRIRTSAVFDKSLGEWIKDSTLMLKELKNSKDAYSIEYAEKIVSTTNIYDIKTINAQGWAETYEDLTGDEDHRVRHMNFCILNPPKSICGMGKVAYLADGPKGDLTQRALKIIRSIEILEDVPLGNVPPAPSQDTTSPSRRQTGLTDSTSTFQSPTTEATDPERR